MGYGQVSLARAAGVQLLNVVNGDNGPGRKLIFGGFELLKSLAWVIASIEEKKGDG
jgi:hypothetical protein